MAPRRHPPGDPQGGLGAGARPARVWGPESTEREGEPVPRRDGDKKERGGLTGAGNDFFQLVLEYAKQETLGPLKGLARFVLAGVAGSLALAAGCVFLLLAGLRAIQTETGSTFTGNLSWLPYIIAAAAAVIVMALAAWRITKGTGSRARPARPKGGE